MINESLNWQLHKLMLIANTIGYQDAADFIKHRLLDTADEPDILVNFISWIKWYRNKTGCSLKEAKEAGDRVRAEKEKQNDSNTSM